MMLLLSRLFCAMPIGLARAVGRFLAWIWYWFLPVGRGVAHRNLQMAYRGELSRTQRRRIVRRCIDIQAIGAVELLRAVEYTRERSLKDVHPTGMEHIDRALEQGKGCIVVASHVGSIDLMGYSQAILGYPMHVVVKDIHWKPAQDFIGALRERTGVTLISPRKSSDVIRQTLADNKIVALIADQHMNRYRGLVCEFFGMLASTTPAPARFHFDTGAPVVTAVMYRRRNTSHFDMTVEPFEMERPHGDLDSDIRHNTERLNAIIEDWIRKDPGQWLWLHKRWKVQDNPEGFEIPEKLQHLVRGVDQVSVGTDPE
ncbi:MAG: lysophospholipid acyltransferase family protein [Acidobacteria bacterium]|nr:lysophospholipid acyltransferase family protein [Acidobacteriota bacterium]